MTIPRWVWIVFWVLVVILVIILAAFLIHLAGGAGMHIGFFHIGVTGHH